MTDQPDRSDSGAQPGPAACDCCVDPRIGAHFDERTQELSEGGKVLPPMMRVTRRLLAQLDDVESERPTILELGCGSAALLVTLLTRGAASADGVDLSPAAIATAQRRAADAGVADRAQFVLADGALATHSAHDWVLLDRAICCYPDMPRLIDAALSATPLRVAFSVPTSRGVPGIVNKLTWGFENFQARGQKNECPGFVHDLNDIERRLTAAGFQRRSTNSSVLWYAAVWDRSRA